MVQYCHCRSSVFCFNTVFRQINAPGAETQNEPLSLSDFNETHSVEILDTSTLSGRKIIQIGWVVSEILPVKIKSWGRVYPSRCINSAKYGIYCVHPNFKVEVGTPLLVECDLSPFFPGVDFSSSSLQIMRLHGVVTLNWLCQNLTFISAWYGLDMLPFVLPVNMGLI